MLRSLFILSFVLAFSSAWGQRFYPSGVKSRSKVAVAIGSSTYYGDLQSSSFAFSLQPNIGIGYEYRLSRHLAGRADISWFKLEGSDKNANSPDRVARNLSFTSSNFEASVQAVVYLFSHLDNHYAKREKFNLYGFMGLGVTRFKPQAEYNGNLYDLRAIQTEGVAYSEYTTVVPFGLGIKYKIADRIDLGVEASYRVTSSDYLDDVSTVYRNPESFQNPTHALLADRRVELNLLPQPAGTVRGNPNNKDGYSFINVRLEYYIIRYDYKGKRWKKLLH